MAFYVSKKPDHLSGRYAVYNVDNGNVLCWAETDEHGKTIVNSLNLHDELVGCLKRAQSELGRLQDHNCWMLCDDIVKAIAKADGDK